MKIKYLILALLPFSLMACQSMNQTQPVSVVQEQKVDATKTLTAYTWSFQPEGAPQPIILSFSDQNLSIHTGCNNQGGTWKLNDQQLVTSALASTMKAC